MEAYFEDNNLQNIKAIHTAFVNIEIGIAKYRKHVEDRKEDLVAHETLTGFLDYSLEDPLSPTDITKVEASENAQWDRKEHIENKFSSIFDKLTKLENNI